MKFQEYRNQVIEQRNEIGRCPLCGANIQDRTIALFKELVMDLYKVYRQCELRNNYYFTMKDIRNLLTKNTYARFGDLVRFSGLVFKINKHNYGINQTRCEQFFKGELEIPVEVTINQITNEVVSKKCIDIHKFPELKKFMSVDGFYKYKEKFDFNNLN
jgi:hypothetical protein